MVLPWALPTVVNAQMWRFILNSQYGALNALLTQLHIIGSYQSWLGSPFLALNMVTMADVWKNTSLVAFFLLAGLQTISSDLHEAAVVDGASPWQRFWRITMPLLKSSILVVLVLRTIEAFKVFDIIYIMTRGGPANGTQSIAYFTYVRAFSDEKLRLWLGAGLPDRDRHPCPGGVLHPRPTQLGGQRDMSVLTPSRRYSVFVHVMAIAVCVVILAPFGWLLIASIANDNDLLAVPLHWIPQHPTFDRYVQIFTAQGDNVFAGFRSSFFNSLIVATSTVLISTTVGVFGAYAFARLRFRGRRAVLMFFLSTYMVPPIALVIPMYLVMVQLHLLDTVFGLIVVYSSFATPFVLWIMGNYFQSIPFELEEAARIDGCSRMGALFRVILPLARPGLLAMMLFAFLIAWDEFLYALIFTSTAASKTIPVAISEFTGRYTTNFGLQAAGGVLAALPPVIIAAIFQRQIVGGLSGGAVKG